MTSTPAACSNALMLRPLRPTIRPFISSFGRGTTDDVTSATCSDATRWMASAISLRARFSPSSRALGLDLSVDPGHVCPGFLLHRRHQLFLGLVLRQLGNVLKLRDLLLIEFVGIVGALVYGALPLVKRLLALLQFVGTAFNLRATLVEPVRFFA